MNGATQYPLEELWRGLFCCLKARMKKHNILSAVLAVVLCAGFAQADPRAGYDKAQVLERGPHHKVITSTGEVVLPDGSRTLKTNKVTIVSNGMHRREGGKWVEAVPRLREVGGSVLGEGAAHTARFPRNLNSQSVRVEMPNGEVFKARVLGLAYQDTALGTNVLIAEPKDSAPVIISSNRVCYPNCFDGLRASVIYSYDRGSIHQDVGLEEQPPLPEEWGLSSTSSFLVVISEIEEMPRAKVSKQSFSAMGDVLADDDIKFGSMRLAPGGAFLKKNGKSHNTIRVAKQYAEIEGRKILFEKVSFKSIRSDLKQLPPAGFTDLTNAPAGMATNSAVRKPGRFFADRTLPVLQRGGAAEPKSTQVAALGMSQNQYVLDWDLVANTDQLSFESGTFIIDGPVYINNAAFTHQAVLKFTSGSSIRIDNFAWYGDPIEHAVLTSANDATFGEDVSEYRTGDPFVGSYGPALLVPSSILSEVQSHFDVYYASSGIVAQPCYVSISSNDGAADKSIAGDNASFQIFRTSTEQALTVYYTVSGTAQSGTDYTPLSGSVSMPVGVSSAYVTVVPTQVHNVALSRVMLTLSASANYERIDPISSQVLIRDSSLLTPFLLNMDFATDVSPEVGPAAIGLSASDYWNAMHSSYSQWAISNNLYNASYVQTSISCTLSNLSGSWGFDCPDLMQGNYVYRSGGPGFTILSNVPPGFYDLYLYSHDGNYDLTVGTQDYGNRRTHDWPVRLPFVWEEGVQYAVYRGVQVFSGDAIRVRLSAGVDGYSLLAGLQLINHTAPAITNQPVSQTVCQNGGALFTVGASGGRPLWYQWKKDGNIIYGATTSAYTISSAQASHAGNYSVVVSNIAGQVTSGNALLTVTAPPAITSQPQGQVRNEGTSASFSVAASGTGLTYQWTRNDGVLAGATASSLAIASVSPAAAGTYKVIVSKAGCSTTSAGAVLTCIPATWLTQYFGTGYLQNSQAAPTADPDNDGLTNAQEYQRNTIPIDADTDNDGAPDGWEVTAGLNPLSAADGGTDSDSDGLGNGREFLWGTDPLQKGTFGIWLSNPSANFLP